MSRHVIPALPKFLKIRHSVPGINPIYFLKLVSQELDLLLESQKNIFWFGYGRNAVEYMLRVLNLKSGTEILFPYYSCNVLLPIFHRYGLCVKFYRVNERLQPDFIQMKSLISNQTQLLLVVNYFGFCQDYRAIKDFCNEHNLIFLEDNAGGFYSIVNGKKMGSFGDISITCVRKTLPLINGSYLAINNSDLMKNANLTNNLNLFKEKREFFQLIRSFYRWFSNSSTLLLKRRTYVIPEYYLTEDELRSYDYTFYQFSPISSYLIRRLGLFQIKQQRKKMYKTWQDWLKQFSDITPIFSELPEGVNPQCFPVYTERRDEWLKWGVQHGIDVYSWPSLSSEQQSKETLALWKKTCCFPIS